MSGRPDRHAGLPRCGHGRRRPPGRGVAEDGVAGGQRRTVRPSRCSRAGQPGDRGTGLSAERRRPGAGPGTYAHDRRAVPGDESGRPVPAGLHPRAGGAPAGLHDGVGVGPRPVGRAASPTAWPPCSSGASRVSWSRCRPIWSSSTPLSWPACRWSPVPAGSTGSPSKPSIDFDQEHACRELTDVPAGAEPRDGLAHRRSS